MRYTAKDKQQHKPTKAMKQLEGIQKYEKQNSAAIIHFVSALILFLIISICAIISFFVLELQNHTLLFSLTYLSITIVSQLIVFIIHIRKLNKIK